MALYKDASGQLVVAASLPPGGTTVSSAATNNLVDKAPWFRNLDAPSDATFHPANYYSGSAESGNNTLSGYLSNPAVTVAADSAGVVASFSAAAGNFKVFRNGVDISASCTFSSSGATNITASINSTSGAYSATALSADVGWITLTATYAGASISFIFTVVKAKSGTSGSNGTNTATVYLFQRTASATPPSLPSATVTYTFATGAVSGVNNGWTQSMPTTGGAYRWVTTATALSASSTDTISSGEWAAAAILAQDGTNGATGSAGTRGSGEFYTSGSAWSDATATAAVAAVFAGGNVYGDTVTISNGTSFAMTKYWNGSAWVAPGAVIDGNLLVSGSVSAAKINSNGLTIRDPSGNVILNAGGGAALDQSLVSGLGAFATLGQITAGNISTYISGAAIGSAQILDLAVSSLKLGTNSIAKLSSVEVASISVPGSTLTPVASLTYASTIPASRDRYLLISFSGDGPLGLKVIQFSATSNSFLDTVLPFYTTSTADARLHSATATIAIPANSGGNNVTVAASITLSTAGTESNIVLSVLEVLG